ncbi:MAG TPA: RNA polymerase sigma factor [Ktedonobacterales bacterium]|nr:RNA polymerase sigma factor [Ktedonobacterales bacterium]
MNTLLAQQMPGIVDADDYLWLRQQCTRLAHDDDVGADLTQETLMEAWRNRHKLTEPQGRRAWLRTIAEHVYHRWLRSLEHETRHLAWLDDAGEYPSSEDDFVHDLERDELATLLDHALALLPDDLRVALIAHYVEEMPQNEIAARLGISQGTLAVRLHRGRLRLQHIFATDLRDEAAAFGLDAAASPDWQETRLWCYQCGQQRLRVRFNRTRNQLLMRCPGCGPQIAHQTTIIAGARSYRAAFDRILQWIGGYFPPALVSGTATCVACGHTAPLRPGLPAIMGAASDPFPSVHIACPCQAIDTCGVPLFAMASPVGQAFRREHPRIRLEKQTPLEAGGIPALALTIASVTDSAKLHLTVASDTYRVLDIQTD